MKKDKTYLNQYQKAIISSVLIFLIILFFVLMKLKHKPLQYRFPGEFEPQQSIWMQWPSALYNSTDHQVNPVLVRIIKAFTPHIRVNLMAVSDFEIIQIRNYLKANGFSGRNLHFYLVPHSSIWARDVGPVFVKDSRNRLAVVDFGFNNYSRDGNPGSIFQEDQVDRLIARLLKLPIIKSALISEGGAIESNGKGTLMVVAAVALKRNPQVTKAQIEAEYKRVLGLKTVIWLDKGLAEDDRITSGHINEFARFADPHTILLGRILPEERNANPLIHESYLRLEENYRILKTATDQDGKPFTIIRVPMPPISNVFDSTGNIIVRSYLNYAVTNGAVLIQSYWKPGRSQKLKTAEDEVGRIFRKAFPKREIISIDAEEVNWWGGGIHCITQHEPK